jgi:hypothetical protein
MRLGLQQAAGFLGLGQHIETTVLRNSDSGLMPESELIIFS